MVEMAFPATVEIYGLTYERDKLFEELLASPKLRKLVAEKYHSASNELYWERLVEVAVQKKKGKEHEGVRILSKSYENEDALRRALQDGSQSFREQVGKACGYPRSQWLLELYCTRLLEIAFPAIVKIEGELFREDTLRAALKSDVEFCQRVARDRLRDQDAKGIEQIIARVFRSKVAIGDRSYSKYELANILPTNPKLQQRLATYTD